MVKGLLIGFFAGALAAAVMVKLLDRSPEAGAGPGGESTTGASGGAGTSAEPDGVPGLRARVEAAELETGRLQARVRELEAQLRARPAGTPGTNAASRAAKWRELADLIAAAKAEADRTGQPIRNDTYLAPLLELIGEFMRETGLPLGEAAMSPDWYPVFSLSALGASPFPPTAEQKAAWEAILGTSRGKWAEYLARRDGMTPLERAQALREIEFSTRTEMAKHATPEQVNWMTGLNMPPPATPVGAVNCGAGPREACRANLQKQWQAALQLDASQVTSLGPVMDDYVREMNTLQSDIDRRRAAGETVDDQAARIALMLDYQKRIGGTARLSEQQQKLLRDWNTTYELRVKE